MKRITKRIVGVVLIILGLAALLTPLSPGSWLILIGLEFLGLRMLLQDRLLDWAGAHPDSRLSKLLCRILRTRSRNPEAKSRWRQKCQP
jgi:hypothetical protein